MVAGFGDEYSGKQDCLRVYGQLDTVLARPVWVSAGVVTELGESLRPATLEVGLVVGFEPVVDEVTGAGERCVQDRGVVLAAQAPMPPVGVAELRQRVPNLFARAEPH